MRDLYRRLGEEGTWETYIARLRQEHRRLRALQDELNKLLDSERRARCARFGVTSLEEMDDLLKTGRVEEEDILEDFQHVDYLITQIQRIRQLLEEI